MKVKALIIDDEHQNLANLQALIGQYCPLIEICGTAISAETGKALIYQHKPDLIFLDIQMSVQNGFDMLRSLATRDFEVIFVTAYDEYAIQAMRFAATDYLLKPVDITELQNAVDRAIKKCSLKLHNQHLENLLHMLQEGQSKSGQHIALATAKEIHFVKTDEIIRCESSNNYTTFYLVSGTPMLVCRPIYEYEDLLKEYGFLRCHQSHLINKKYIKSWKRELGDFLSLTDGSEVPVSRGKKEEVKRALRL